MQEDLRARLANVNDLLLEAEERQADLDLALSDQAYYTNTIQELKQALAESKTRESQLEVELGEARKELVESQD